MCRIDGRPVSLMRGSFEETARRGLDEGRARAKNDTGVAASQIVRKQGKRNGRQASAGEDDNLCREKLTIRPILEWRRHVHRLPNFPQRLQISQK